MKSTESPIITESLCRSYGERTGIADVDLRVDPGQIFGFLGSNGAGKTTTIRVLLGLLRPTSGRATVFGLDCWHQSKAVKQDVGYLPGDLRLYPWFNARRALSIVERVRGKRLVQEGLELSERFGLDPNVTVRRMSRGMRQKLGIILALAHRPRLLILDEPSTGLDPLMQDALASHLRNLAAAGHTIFFSSHSLSEVEQLCDHIAIVRNGSIVADESLDSLRARAKRTVKVEFKDATAAKQAVLPEFLHPLSQSGSVWICELTGTIDRFVTWAAQQSLSDLELGPPDLESLFRKFYRVREDQ